MSMDRSLVHWPTLWSLWFVGQWKPRTISTQSWQVIDDESMTCALLLMKESCRAIVFVFSLMARLTDSFNCFLFLCQLTAWFLFSYGRLVVDTRKLRKQLYCHFCCYHLWPQGCSLFSITGAKGNNRYYDSIWFLLISFFLLLTAGSLFVPGGC